MPDGPALSIERVGARGDGIAKIAGETIYVPYGLPGEVWQQDADGAFHCRSAASDRADPICPHFGVCGGCVAQHMAPAFYSAWKGETVRQAFAHQGIDIPVPAVRTVAHQTRRRCVLTAARFRDRLVLGYHEARSRALVDLTACPVLVPAIVSALDGLRAIAAALTTGAGKELRLTVLASDSGLDVSVTGNHVPLTPDLRERLAQLALEQGLARLVVGGDEVVQLQRPVLAISGVDVPMPSGVFVQAAETAEQWLAEAVVAAAGTAKSVADLFCGVGTFSFALARRARVHALDSDREAIAALQAGRDGARRLKPIEARVRDLMREPLSRKELEPYDCVVFDPPRAGAAGQSKMLAKSRVPTVVAVSCNPATLARDVRNLLDGGYALENVQLIDQFLFSAHIEAVAVLRRADRRR